MSINTVNYPTPVTVNGYACKNCTDVDNAKRNIDPQHPKDGPFGINAADHKTGALKTDPAKDPSKSDRNSAVVFGGQLAALLANGQGVPASAATQNSNATTGTRLDISA